MSDVLAETRRTFAPGATGCQLAAEPLGVARLACARVAAGSGAQQGSRCVGLAGWWRQGDASWRLHCFASSAPTRAAPSSILIVADGDSRLVSHKTSWRHWRAKRLATERWL